MTARSWRSARRSGKADLTGTIGVQQDGSNPINFLDDHTNSPFTMQLRRYLDDAGRTQFDYTAAGFPTKYQYDDSVWGTGQIVSVIAPEDAATGIPTEVIELSSAGERLSLKNALNGLIRWKYDGLGRMIQESLRIEKVEEDGTLSGHRDVMRTWEYDGRTTIYNNRNGQEIVTISDIEERTVAEQYTDNGTTYTKTSWLHSDGSLPLIQDVWSGGARDGDGSFVEYQYDSFGRPKQVTQGFTFLGHQAPQSRTQTDYDVDTDPANPHVRTNVSTLWLDATDDGQENFKELRETTHRFDSHQRLTGVAQDLHDNTDTDPLYDAGYVPGDKSVEYLYNSLGEMVRVNRHTNATFSAEKSYSEWIYHGDGRPKDLIHHVEASPQDFVHASYGSEFDDRGLLTERNTLFHDGQDPIGENEYLLFEYDHNGQLRKRGERDTPTSQTIEWTIFGYDAIGHYLPELNTFVGRGGRQYKRQLSETPLKNELSRYDDEGYLTDVDEVGAVIISTRDLTWDAMGRLLETHKLENTDDHSRELIGYDVLGRVVGLKW